MISRTICHCRLLEKFGGGGIGVVHKVEDTFLKRAVALKVLPGYGCFQREFQAASALSHPDICTIYEIADHCRQAYVAVAFLEGQTLKHRIGARAMNVETLMALSTDIADALDTAHSRETIHSDIKPANNFVTAVLKDPVRQAKKSPAST